MAPTATAAASDHANSGPIKPKSNVAQVGSAPLASLRYTTEGRVQPTSRTTKPFTDEDIREFTEICKSSPLPKPPPVSCKLTSGAQQTPASDYPLASSIVARGVVYDASTLLSAVRGGQETRDAAMAELHHCLLSGPGVFIVKDAFDTSVVDRASRAFGAIIERERAANGGQARGDHFAKAGANDRIWNSFQKLAAEDPRTFVEYYANEILALASEAWLGPGYAITAQTNIVKPGGKAQEPHRDYHLGFQDAATAARFPLSAQVASQLLTLQGAVAHTDMPVESGPTQLLPFSQRFEHGFLAYREPAFREVFAKHMVQIPLTKGDALFFNPALFHAAGDNRTADVQRSANLVQISACWGKPMETVDRSAIVKATWDELQAFATGKTREVTPTEVEALLAAVPDAYSFPTNLDNDPPPPNGHCPPTQKDRVVQGVKEGVDAREMARRIDEYDEIRKA